mmetsp:Transcript_27254/g.48552  ORF Transcript_27254/g.48552 Transcript_27254/m.48552 type:complete len:215 (+) Transcript_27254:288-932(+)
MDTSKMTIILRSSSAAMATDSAPASQVSPLSSTLISALSCRAASAGGKYGCTGGVATAAAVSGRTARWRGAGMGWCRAAAGGLGDGTGEATAGSVTAAAGGRGDCVAVGDTGEGCAGESGAACCSTFPSSAACVSSLGGTEATAAVTSATTACASSALPVAASTTSAGSATPATACTSATCSTTPPVSAPRVAPALSFFLASAESIASIAQCIS